MYTIVKSCAYLYIVTYIIEGCESEPMSVRDIIEACESESVREGEKERERERERERESVLCERERGVQNEERLSWE